MPIARLVGNGMDFADAIELHAMVDQGAGLARGRRVELARRNLSPRATGAAARPSAERAHLVHAGLGVLSLRAGAAGRRRPAQTRALPAHARRLPPRRRTRRAPGGADRAALARRAPHGLAAAQRPPTPHPFVVQLCGIGGSREEYEVGSRYLLERGITALLVDAPGQGETRLFEGLYLDEHVTEAISAFVDVALADRTATVASACGATAPAAGSRR